MNMLCFWGATLTLLAFTSTVNSQASVFITAPSIFRLNIDETVSVLVNQPAAVELYLQNLPQRSQIISKKIINVKANEPGIITLKITENELPKSRDGMFHFVLVAKSKSPAFNKETNVALSLRNGTVFVQTAKPIYTPKQLVQYRIIPVGPDLLPSHQKIDVIIQNPDGVKVRKIKGLDASANGFVSDKFVLDEYAILGNWTIFAMFGDRWLQNSTVKFEVREYVLPTFSVVIIPPSYIVEEDKTFSLRVKSVYSYDKFVSGVLVLKLSVLMNKKSIPVYSSRSVIDGPPQIMEISLDQILSNKDVPEFPFGAHLDIDATVIESASGKAERAKDISALFVKSPFLITRKQTPGYYKPGLPFNVLVDITYTNKYPAFDVVTEIEATANAKAIAVDGGAKMTDRTTPANGGKLRFTLDMPLAYQGNGDVVVTITASRGALKKSVLKFTVSPYISPSKSYLLVRAPASAPKVGEYINMEALIPNALDGISQISYMMISKGIILEQGTKLREAGRITSIRVKIIATMSPAVRFIAYYVRRGEVVADSVLIRLGNTYGNQLEIQTPKTEMAPGGDVTFKVVTDQQTGYFGLLGVDETVYYLRDSGKLDLSRIGKELDTFDTGCGIGGGKDNSDVFMNAGVVTLTNVALNVNTRKALTCPKPSVAASRKRRSVKSSPEVLEKNKMQFKTCCGPNSCCSNKTSPAVSSDNCLDLADALLLKDDCRLTFLRCCVFRFEDLGRSVDLFGIEAPDEIIEEISQLRIRQYFPETWIWQEDDYKSLERIYTLPDTITSWIVSGISVNNVTGLGVSPPLRITGYMPFFVDIKMPYSVKRLEQVNILAVLYNYGDNQKKVHLQLFGDESFCSIAPAGKPSKSLKLTIEAHNAMAIPFTITPLRAGKIPIQFVAYTSFGGDRIRKDLLVKSEGVERVVTRSMVLDPQGRLDDAQQGKAIRKDGRQTNIINIAIPDNFISGSEQVKVFVTGNLMASVVTSIIEKGLNTLIRLPGGCGEQTMKTMAPCVYVLQYLEAIKSGMTAAIEKNAYSYMRSGYRRILGYMQGNGAFSAFTNRPGSTWLTAFVTKVLCQAKQFIKDDIDEERLCGAVAFLLSTQGKDGAFIETNAVIHQEMIGGVKGKTPMTAYVLTSLLECGPSCGPKVSGAIIAATLYLEGQFATGAITNKFILSLVTYALALAKSPIAEAANNQLMTMTTVTNKNGQTLRHVEVVKGNFAMNTEATAYALLVQMELGKQENQGPMVVWLTEQRNSKGSFHSTQDTCVALQALAKYSEESSGSKLDLKIELTSAIKSDIKETFKLSPDNAFIRQESEITRAIGGNIFIDTIGEGTAELQIETRYNIPATSEELCNFDLSIEATEVNNNVISDQPLSLFKPKKDLKKKKKCTKKNRHRKRCKKGKQPDPSNIQKDEVPGEMTIKICARYKLPEKTGFAMVEAYLLTGFEADVNSLKKLMGVIDKYELDGVKVTLYFNEIPNDKPLCVSFLTKRKFDVGLVQAVPVKVYTYYNPDSACTKFYHPSKGSELLKVICEGEECECGQGGCHVCDASGGKKVMTKQACTKSDFVFQGEILEVKPQNSWERISVRIKTIIKAGKLDLHPGSKVLVYKLTSCECPKFVNNKEYLFMLKDGMKYLINADAYVREWPTNPAVQQRYRGIMGAISDGVVCDDFAADEA